MTGYCRRWHDAILQLEGGKDMFGVTLQPMTQTTSGSFDKTGDSIEGRQSSPQKGFSRRSPRPASRQDHEAFFKQAN